MLLCKCWREAVVILTNFHVDGTSKRTEFMWGTFNEFALPSDWDRCNVVEISFFTFIQFRESKCCGGFEKKAKFEMAKKKNFRLAELIFVFFSSTYDRVWIISWFSLQRLQKINVTVNNPPPELTIKTCELWELLRLYAKQLNSVRDVSRDSETNRRAKNEKFS